MYNQCICLSALVARNTVAESIKTLEKVEIYLETGTSQGHCKKTAEVLLE